jgi:hypothetical protein
MKTALIISGLARFCEALDVQLNSFKNYDNIDWFVTLWNKTVSPESYDIAPIWRDIDTAKARKLLEERLPANHKLVYIEVKDTNSCPPNPHNIKGWYYDENRLWAQYTILRWCDQVRQSYEQQNGKYDIIIRSRPDTVIKGEIDLEHWGEILKQNPKYVILPYPDRSGSRGFNDRFGIFSSDGMTDFTNSMDLWLELHHQGILWNPEELLGSAMMAKGYSWPSTNFDSVIKGPGHTGHSDGSRWIPHFGRWA